MESTTMDEIVHRVSNVAEEVGASVCFGAPVERDGHTLIPVARVAFGFGMGFGRGTNTERGEDGAKPGESNEGEGGGGGGGGTSTPVAVVDISGDEVKIEPITDSTRIALSGIALAGWIAFWFLWTVRTVARQRASTQRLKIQKGLA